MERKILPELYQAAFTRGETGHFSGRLCRFSVVRAGTLHLPSGQIVACDPLVGLEREPFVQAVLPGRYAVDFSLGQDIASNVERILFARILFTKNRPIAWIRALRESDADSTAQESSRNGFSLRSGTAALMDKETADQFRLESIAEIDRILDDLVANYRPERNWLNKQLDDRHNLIMFSPGAEPAVYPSYFAVDDDGDICLALTQLVT